MKKNQNRILFLIFLVMLTVLASTVFVCAADPATPPTTTSADSVWSGLWGLLTTWLIRIGAGVALFGGVNIAISFNSDNPDAKARGLNSLAAGLLLMAIGAGPQIFGVS